MRPVSDRFLRTLTGSHSVVADARVVPAGLTGTNPAGVDVPILDGDVRLDGTAAIRSTVDLTTTPDMWPTLPGDPLVPYGNELFVRRGIQYGNGTREWVSLGYHRIWSPSQDDAPRGPVRVMAQDRMAGIIDAKLTAPVQFAATATYGTVVESLIEAVYPWATIEWDDDTDTDQLGRSLIAEDERHKFVDELITGLGKIWYWDHRGILVIRTPPDPAVPVWTVAYGAGGVLVSLGRELSREGVYNGVVATGEGADTGTPIRAVVVDNDPDSPTYWHGPFGQVPFFLNSASITSVAQATSAARVKLMQAHGLPYSVDFTVVPNPALEPSDPVRVRYPGRSELHVIEKVTIPLVAEQVMPATTRERTNTVFGRL